jgi:hypothetical protein
MPGYKVGETIGKCGCRLERTEKGLTMVDCPLHGAASDLLDICIRIFESVHKGKATLEDNGQLLLLKQAIAKAEAKS